MEVPFDLLKLAGGEGLLMFVVVAPAVADLEFLHRVCRNKIFMYNYI
jgi:hypothetical protein